MRRVARGSHGVPAEQQLAAAAAATANEKLRIARLK